MNKLSEEKERVTESHPSTSSDDAICILKHDDNIEQASTLSLRKERWHDESTVCSSTTRTSRGANITQDSSCNALHHEKCQEVFWMSTTIFAFVCAFGLSVGLFFVIQPGPKTQAFLLGRPECSRLMESGRKKWFECDD